MADQLHVTGRYRVIGTHPDWDRPLVVEVTVSDPLSAVDYVRGYMFRVTGDLDTVLADYTAFLLSPVPSPEVSE